MTPEAEIQEWLSKGLSRRKSVRITKLPGDASTRAYYRIRHAQGSNIVMKMESFAKLKQGLPFIRVRDHLARSGVDVPRIHASNPARGLLLLEDLGDTTLLRRLQHVTDSEVERSLYEDVIDNLIQMHLVGSTGKNSAVPAFSLFFDYEKLFWEVEFAIEHFYLRHLKRKIKSADLSLLRRQWGRICRTLAAEPRVFTHRDFHSRNIMVSPSIQGDRKHRLTFIDFQDARMGPPQYDLASLLKDSYYQLDELQVRRLVDYYVTRFEALSDRPIARAHFFRIFDLMSAQRNFKAIGSFASFSNLRDNSTYLKYIGNTFENIRRTLLKYPEYADLREVLFHYYYF